MKRRWLDCFTNGLVVLTCLMLLIRGLRFVWRVGLVGSPALGIPMSWWYAAASVGLLLMACIPRAGRFVVERIEIRFAGAE